MVHTMPPPRKKPTPPARPSAEGVGREWEAQKEFFVSISVYRDVAKWATELAKDSGVRVAKFLDPRLREWLWNEYRAMLARKQQKAEGPEPPPPPAAK